MPPNPTSQKRRSRHSGSRMYARTQTLRKMNLVAFYLLLMISCIGVIATSLPQYELLQQAEEELSVVTNNELLVLAQADQQKREYLALEQDPQFLEIYGRDRLDLYKEGERVFRFERPN